MHLFCIGLYCHRWPVWLYHIFPHYLTKARISKQKKELKFCVLIFFLQLSSESFVILRRIQRDIIRNVPRSSCKTPFTFVRINETRIISPDFQKLLNINSREFITKCSNEVYNKFKKYTLADSSPGEIQPDTMHRTATVFLQTANAVLRKDSFTPHVTTYNGPYTRRTSSQVGTNPNTRWTHTTLPSWEHRE